LSDEYLFVAEADKIQDLLFRSSKLREVVGGSQLLEEFCKEATPNLAQRLQVKFKTVISAGGSFRLLFDSEEKAKKFGEYLAELYRRTLGGTITIGEPVKVTLQRDAITKAQEHLRKAKHSGKAPTSVDQIPYTALCASCGVGIAYEYKRRFPEEREKYLCEVCVRKEEARKEIKKRFLANFLGYVEKDVNRELIFPKSDADDVGKLERRNYIAYLVADGNNMGVVFGSCNNFNQLKILSDKLDEIVPKSLAKPTVTLIKKQEKSLKKLSGKLNVVPVLPLILAGDDVFSLIPAQWALDFAVRFSEEFEKNMKNALKEIDLEKVPPPTISSSVVICKSKFPYQEAYEIAEEHLKIAKKVAKKENASTINFTIVTGSKLPKELGGGKVFVAGYPVYKTSELKTLIDYRFKLKDLPGTRRAQLESLYAKAEELDYKNMKSFWLPQRTYLLERLDNELKKKLNDALTELGSCEEGNWINMDNRYYHKLPDLLRVWDFAYDLEKDLSDYEEVEL